MTCGAVVVAAGNSQRMGLNKTMMPLAGRPVILHVLDVLGSVTEISRVVIVTNSENLSQLESLVDTDPIHVPIELCLGGDTRQASVRNGVGIVGEDVDFILIHDAARPLITADVVERGVSLAMSAGAAIAGVPVTDTIKRVDSTHVIQETVDRSTLTAAQTPQIFRREWLQRAYRRVDSSDSIGPFTDESALLEWAGFTVHVFPGSKENIKLTTPIDVALAETILSRRVTVAR